MIRLGVYSLTEFNPNGKGFASRLRWRLTRSRVALTLLSTGMPPDEREREAFEFAMYHLRIANGVCRSTFQKRFQDFDPIVNELLCKRFHGGKLLTVCDQAASDCRASSEWAASIFGIFPEARFEASDVALSAMAVTTGGRTLVEDYEGRPLQLISGCFVENLTGQSWPPVLGPILRSVAEYYSRRIVNAGKPPAEWLRSDSTELDKDGCSFRKLPLVHPDARFFAQREPRFTIARHSIFDRRRERVDVIRTMNIFNFAYFSEEKIAEGVRAVWESLAPEGVWIVGRTWTETPHTHNATIYGRTDTGFIPIHRHGEGTEIESIVSRFVALPV